MTDCYIHTRVDMLSTRFLLMSNSNVSSVDHCDAVLNTSICTMKLCLQGNGVKYCKCDCVVSKLTPLYILLY